MFGWTEDQQTFQAALRRFVEKEIAPNRAALESGELPPYDLLRRYFAAFGVGEAALERFERSLDPSIPAPAEKSSAAEKLIPVIELSRHAPGLVAALGVSVDLTAGAILRAGSEEQRRRWVPGLLTLEKVGAWALTEPDSGSDAFGSMRSTAEREGDGWVINGSKTFITNGPYADAIVFIAKLRDRENPSLDQIGTFVLERGTPGLEQTPPLQKLGLHSSPTGEVFADNVRVGDDHLLRRPVAAAGKADSKAGARATFATERASIAAMALGIIERCLELSVDYARTRVQFGRPIGEFQLVQLKLAQMEVARLNVENLVLRYIAMVDAGSRPTLAEASAMKLYSAQSAMQVALEAVQIYGGNGYMVENPVEQFYRDAKALQIYAGTDEIQVIHIARDLLRAAPSV